MVDFVDFVREKKSLIDSPELSAQCFSRNLNYFIRLEQQQRHVVKNNKKETQRVMYKL
jgi:hypothetical protein